jgi:uncharacterized membrane protein YdcZ (DUF606 family)
VLALFFWMDVSLQLISSLPTKQGVQAAPWWCWFGGPMGAVYVASVIIFAPRLGAWQSLTCLAQALR